MLLQGQSKLISNRISVVGRNLDEAYVCTKWHLLQPETAQDSALNVVENVALLVQGPVFEVQNAENELSDPDAPQPEKTLDCLVDCLLALLVGDIYNDEVVQEQKLAAFLLRL